MEIWVPISGILAAILAGAISPGPSFVLVARTSVAQSRRNGVATALGMGAGAVVFGALALLGLQALLAQVGWLYAGLRVLGGLFLLYLALRIWRSAREPLEMTPGSRPARGVAGSLALGFATQVSNPKTAIVYASIFAALLPGSLPLWALLLLPPLIFLVEAGWYVAVALAFSAPRPQSLYIRLKTWIDRAAAAVMGGLGVKLIVEAGREVR